MRCEVRPCVRWLLFGTAPAVTKQELLERERAIAEGVELEKKEEEFHLNQARCMPRQATVSCVKQPCVSQATCHVVRLRCLRHSLASQQDSKLELQAKVRLAACGAAEVLLRIRALPEHLIGATGWCLQARVRAEIRTREGRPKPIDLLARNLSSDSYGTFDFGVDPVGLFDNLTAPELSELELDLRNAQVRVRYAPAASRPTQLGREAGRTLPTGQLWQVAWQGSSRSVLTRRQACSSELRMARW